MVGRKENIQFNRLGLGFTLKKYNQDNKLKYAALCNVCAKTLKNTAAKRLIEHRYLIIYSSFIFILMK